MPERMMLIQSANYITWHDSPYVYLVFVLLFAAWSGWGMQHIFEDLVMSYFHPYEMAQIEIEAGKW